MSITLIIVIITVLVSLKAFKDTNFRNKLIFNPYVILRNNEYHRFLTSGFIHGDFMHLLFNMFVLYMFGTYVENIFTAIYGGIGQGLFVAMYFLGIVISDIPTFFKHRDSPHYNALGASGGVSSLLFSFIIFNPTQDLCLYGLLCFPGILWGILYIIYSFYMGKRGQDNINHDAHLYGGIFGILFTIITVPGVIMNFIEQLKAFSIF
jgi:membrane associated rhomboid family serine protease